MKKNKIFQSVKNEINYDSFWGIISIGRAVVVAAKTQIIMKEYECTGEKCKEYAHARVHSSVCNKNGSGCAFSRAPQASNATNITEDTLLIHIICNYVQSVCECVQSVRQRRYCNWNDTKHSVHSKWIIVIDDWAICCS